MNKDLDILHFNLGCYLKKISIFVANPKMNRN